MNEGWVTNLSGHTVQGILSWDAETEMNIFFLNYYLIFFIQCILIIEEKLSIFSVDKRRLTLRPFLL